MSDFSVALYLGSEHGCVLPHTMAHHDMIRTALRDALAKVERMERMEAKAKELHESWLTRCDRRHHWSECPFCETAYDLREILAAADPKRSASEH